MVRVRTRKRLIKRIIIGACAILTACALTVGIIAINSSKKYNPKKFNGTSVTASGGTSAENVNLSRIEYVFEEDNQTEIKFQFEDTSNQSLSAPPEYTVSFLNAPNRLKVEFSGITCWDYVVSGITTDKNEIIAGMFQQSPGGENKNTYVYFNLMKDVQFKVNENEDGSLSVILKDQGTEKNKTGAYLVCDLFYEYQEGTISDDTFTPTLSNDGVSVLLVSKMYGSVKEAEKARETLMTGKYEGTAISVLESDRFGLVSLSENENTLAHLDESVISIDGAKTTLPLFCSDARFLCWNPDGSSALFAKAENGMETLYLADRTGTKHKLIEQSFATVVKAVYSADGSKIAFIEHTDDTELATVVDCASGEIKVIGSNDDGNKLGNTIFGIALDENGKNLFCLSGDEKYCLYKCDTETNEISVMESELIIESDIFYNAGCLFYCDVVEELEVIVRNQVSTNNRDVIGKGSQFAVSRDGNFVAVISEDYETAVLDLKLFNTVDDEEETIVHDVVCSEFFFSNDASYIYYVVETGDPEFYYQIMRYDVGKKETVPVGQCINAVFSPSNQPEEIIISVNYTENEQIHPVTYFADFNKINESIQSEQMQTE